MFIIFFFEERLMFITVLVVERQQLRAITE